MFGAELQKSHRMVGSRSEARKPNNFDRNQKKVQQSTTKNNHAKI